MWRSSSLGHERAMSGSHHLYLKFNNNGGLNSGIQFLGAILPDFEKYINSEII